MENNMNGKFSWGNPDPSRTFAAGLSMDCDMTPETPDNPNGACKCLDDLPLAMAYVPMQKFRNVYEADVALDRGTAFSELDLPFIGWEGKR